MAQDANTSTSEPASTNTSDSNIVRAAIEAGKHAQELRESAILQLIAQRDQIDRDLKALNYNPAEHNGTRQKPPAERDSEPKQAGGKRFRDMTLAEAGRIVLQEHGAPMHGSEIERIVKAGGYSGTSEKFQSYLAVAFKRDKGFENTGRNTWKLK
jgi:hypothetical protein